MRVAVGYCHREDSLSPWFHESLEQTRDAEARGKRRLRGRVAISSGPRVDMARNDVVRGFLDLDAEWLWMLDTDMMWKPDAFDLLCRVAHEKERQVVGGLCFAGGMGKDIWPTMLLFENKPDGGIGIRRIVSYPKNTLCQVAATGGAFLMVHRSVFERMDDGSPCPWFRYAWLGDEPIGEDVTFCMRLQKFEVPVWVHTGVRVKHMKVHAIGEEDYEEQCRRQKESGEVPDLKVVV